MFSIASLLCDNVLICVRIHVDNNDDEDDDDDDDDDN